MESGIGQCCRYKTKSQCNRIITPIPIATPRTAAINGLENFAADFKLKINGGPSAAGA